ncbi:MAG: DNA polymerase III subunit beta [Elusimicrobiota bacterium]
MKIVCMKDDLLRGMEIISGAVSQKSTLPQLSNLLFNVKDGQLILAATDLEIAAKTVVKAQVLKEGGITLPSKLIIEIIRKLPQQEIDITVEENEKVLIKSGKTKFSLVGLSKTEFPAVINFEGGEVFKIATSVLKEMIIKTKFAISIDDARYVLNGIYFLIEKGRATMVSTDGRRLAYITRENVVDKKVSTTFLIPSKAIGELLKIISIISTEEMEVGAFENQVGFKIGETVLRSRLIDGHFPDYEQVIPKEKKISLKVRTKDLLDATDRVLPFRPSSVRYSFGKGKVLIHLMEQGKGEGDDEIETNYSGEVFTVAYNPNYIIDMLRVVSSKEVIFEFTAPLNPGVLKPVDDPSYTYIIMPLRLE